MTPVLIGKGLLFDGSNPKIEDKQVPGIYLYIYINIHAFICIYCIYVCVHDFHLDPRVGRTLFVEGRFLSAGGEAGGCSTICHIRPPGLN